MHATWIEEKKKEKKGVVPQTYRNTASKISEGSNGLWE